MTITKDFPEGKDLSMNTRFRTARSTRRLDVSGRC